MIHTMRKVGRKIGATSVITALLFFVVGLSALLRLSSITAMVENLSRSLSADMQRTQAIASSARLADEQGRTFLTDKRSQSLERCTETFARLQALLAEAPQTGTMSSGDLLALRTAVAAYDLIFQELTQDIRQQQALAAGALQAARHQLENQLSALRVLLDANPSPILFLTCGNAQNAASRMLLHYAEYSRTGDERHALQLYTAATQARTAFETLETDLPTLAMRHGARLGRQAVGTYQNIFDTIREGNRHQRQLVHLLDTELRPLIDTRLIALQAGLNQRLQDHAFQARELLHRSVIELVAGLAFVLLASGGIGYVVTRSITGPLELVRNTARSLAEHDLRLLTTNLTTMGNGDTRLFFRTNATTLDIRQQDEVGQTARSFDRIVVELGAAEAAFVEMAGYLQRMAAAATAVAEGHLDVAIEACSPEDTLGRAMGRMVTSLTMAREQVRAYQSHLEELVEQRTAQLRAASTRAEAATMAKSDFLARMSHEIRTPMNGLLSMTELALDACSEPVVNGYLKKVLVSARAMLAILNDILDLSKIEAGRMTLEQAEFRLDAVLENVIGVVGSLAEDKGLELVMAVAPDVPYRLIGDSLRLGQVLINLVGNAVKFTHNGTITIAIRTDGIDAETCGLHVEVTDTGIGIPPEALGTIFASFAQANDATSRKYGGTGLGLSICRSLVELMGGRIWAHSEPGQGSSFHFTLRPGRALLDTPPASLDRLLDTRVLVIDDTQAARESLRLLLASAGVHVTCVDGYSGADAALKFALKSKSPFSLIIADWKMPDMDGLTCLRRLRRRQRPLPPTILMAGQITAQLAGKAMREGVGRILLKPMTRTELWDAMAEALDQDEPEIEPVVTELLPFAGRRVLVVDDNAINQEVAKALLSRLGVTVDVADSGQSGLDLVRRNNYDLVLMDIQMPDMDGLEATRCIREDNRFRDLPILAMTAHALPADHDASEQAGMNDHLTKPISADMLQRALARWMRDAPDPSQPLQ